MLSYLMFEAHESTEGVHSFEAMASVPEARWPALQAELAEVLGWCHAWGGARGAPAPVALEEGGEWDFDLQVTREWSEPLDVQFQPDGAEWQVRTLGGAHARCVATLVLSGHEAFAADFSERFLSE